MEGELYPVDMTCGTCHCQRGYHFKTYDDQIAGCMRMVGQITPVRCPCSGFMATESKASRDAHLTNIGESVFRAAVARQDAKDGAKYRSALP